MTSSSRSSSSRDCGPDGGSIREGADGDVDAVLDVLEDADGVRGASELLGEAGLLGVDGGEAGGELGSGHVNQRLLDGLEDPEAVGDCGEGEREDQEEQGYDECRCVHRESGFGLSGVGSVRKVG
jgi:hypothetical protein